MTWLPPAEDRAVPLRQHDSEAGWRVAIELIARKHGIYPCELEPYEKGETIVWRASSPGACATASTT